MPHIINGTNCLDAWLSAANHLIKKSGHDDTNVFITMENPCDCGDLKKWVKKYNPKSVDSGVVHIRQVINTIFPYGLSSYFLDRRDLYREYEQIYTKSKAKKWGTYFQRLISFGRGFEVEHFNQLENAILALQSDSPQKYYITFHLSAINVESNIRPLGGPCWQYGELIIDEEGKVDLVAVYRNHDYFGKALGNFIGLAKLLEFICRSSGRTTGKLMIHSMHAYSEKGVTKLRKLLS